MKKTRPEPATAALEEVTEPARAITLLAAPRLAILARAASPHSATEIAAELDLPRQRVNYHVQALAKAGFLVRAGRRKKRNLWEQRWRRSATAYHLAPELLGALRAERNGLADPVALGAAEATEPAAFALDVDLHFASDEARRRFSQALRDAVAHVVAEHAHPSAADSEGARPYRLALGCRPLPTTDDATREEA